MLQVYCFSLPVVLLCIGVATWIMLYSIWMEESLTEAQHRHGSKLAGYLTLAPSIGYAAMVWLMNFYYRKLATHLTEWGKRKVLRIIISELFMQKLKYGLSPQLFYLPHWLESWKRADLRYTFISANRLF